MTDLHSFNIFLLVSYVMQDCAAVRNIKWQINPFKVLMYLKVHPYVSLFSINIISILFCLDYPFYGDVTLDCCRRKHVVEGSQFW